MRLTAPPNWLKKNFQLHLSPNFHVQLNAYNELGAEKWRINARDFNCVTTLFGITNFYRKVLIGNLLLFLDVGVQANGKDEMVVGARYGNFLVCGWCC